MFENIDAVAPTKTDKLAERQLQERHNSTYSIVDSSEERLHYSTAYDVCTYMYVRGRGTRAREVRILETRRLFRHC